MAVAAGTLTAIGLYLSRSSRNALFRFRPVHLIIGLVSAGVLYGVFLAGDRIATLLFDFAKPEIAGIYATKAQASPVAIGLLLGLWIGPAEEIFWRGYVQLRMAQRYGNTAGWLAGSLIYALVHVWAFNLMLLGAALICGLFWGAMFRYYGTLWPGLISHAVCPVAIFVIWPIR